MYKEITRLPVLLIPFFFGLLLISSDAKTHCQIISFSTYDGDSTFDTTFYQHDGITFTENSEGRYIVGGPIQGETALITDFGHQDGPIIGTLIPPVYSLSMRIAPALQGTAEYILTTFDASGKLIAKDSMVVTQDTGDPQTSPFGYFILEAENLPRRAKSFILENKFIRHFGSNTFIPFAVSEISFSQSKNGCP